MNKAKGRRSSKNKQSGKYKKQALRTALNKQENIAKELAKGNKLAGKSMPQSHYARKTA